LKENTQPGGIRCPNQKKDFAGKGARDERPSSEERGKGQVLLGKPG